MTPKPRISIIQSAGSGTAEFKGASLCGPPSPGPPGGCQPSPGDWLQFTTQPLPPTPSLLPSPGTWKPGSPVPGPPPPSPPFPPWPPGPPPPPPPPKPPPPPPPPV